MRPPLRSVWSDATKQAIEPVLRGGQNGVERCEVHGKFGQCGRAADGRIADRGRRTGGHRNGHLAGRRRLASLECRKHSARTARRPYSWRCDAPRFESAGGHWNPADKEHGLENPKGQHAGDMPNLTIDADGRGTLSYSLKGATIEGIRDADGSALVVHKLPDDQKTDPSGNSGDRLACGVFG